MPRNRTIWITWERHRRTRELCTALDVALFEIVADGSRWARYPVLLSRTVACVMRERPETLLVQCPSIGLGLLAGLLKRVFRFRLVADLHNEAVQPFNYSGRLYHSLVRRVWRSADVCVVSNEALKAVIDDAHRPTYVLPDRLPGLRPGPAAGRRRQPRVVFICTYAPDEPYQEVIAAARILGPAVTMAITGNHRRLAVVPDVPDHVRLTGFLPEAEYEQLLRDADVLVDLTRMADCLVCGAYEAVALEKPLVTSDTAALRGYFHRGTVYSAHDPESLAAAIRDALGRTEKLSAEMRVLKREISASWTIHVDALRGALGAEAG
jgi:glycosyltransferase involved in cell wall biosynthesis